MCVICSLFLYFNTAIKRALLNAIPMQETGDFLCKDVFLNSSEANMRVYSNQVSIFKCVFLEDPCLNCLRLTKPHFNIYCTESVDLVPL